MMARPVAMVTWCPAAGDGPDRVADGVGQLALVVDGGAVDVEGDEVWSGHRHRRYRGDVNATWPRGVGARA